VDESAIERAASLILAARTTRTPLEPLPEEFRPTDERDAYAIQRALNRQLSAAGAGPLGGHKIGCTTPVMQAFLSIPNPCAGAVFAKTVHRAHGTFRTAEHLRLGVECEIAVELGADLDGSRGFSRDEVAGAVAAVMASIEVVDDRYRDYPTLGTPTLIADDFFNAGGVLGTAVGDWRRLDLAAIEGRMTINGEEVGTGRGADILGHPFEALAWLAGSMHERGRALRAGEFVTLGSVVATRWVTAGDEVRIAIDGLGDAVATFE
jgi:2-oxo-3-hexenedioate decarboxylase/2-keto-4-pentenoate hydratase